MRVHVSRAPHAVDSLAVRAWRISGLYAARQTGASDRHKNAPRDGPGCSTLSVSSASQVQLARLFLYAAMKSAAVFAGVAAVATAAVASPVPESAVKPLRIFTPYVIQLRVLSPWGEKTLTLRSKRERLAVRADPHPMARWRT